MTDRREAKINEEFVKNMDKMVDLEEFLIKDFVTEIDSSLNSWMLKIRGAVKTNPEIEQLKKTRELLGNVQEEMGEGHTELDRKQKLTIAAKSTTSLSAVNDTLEQFDRMRLMHGWLRKRKAAGRKMPQTQGEAQHLLQADIKSGDPNKIDKAWLMKQKNEYKRKVMKGRRS